MFYLFEDFVSYNVNLFACWSWLIICTSKFLEPKINSLMYWQTFFIAALLAMQYEKGLVRFSWTFNPY